MAIPTASSFFTSPNFLVNSKQSSPSTSNSVRFSKSRITAAYATADRTETETIRSFSNNNPSSLYEVLGVRIGAEAKEVKAAYRRLARVLHPDVGRSESSADEFMKVHSAYTTLADPAKRADYDRTLVQRRAGGSSLMSFAGGYQSRRWETDQLAAPNHNLISAKNLVDTSASSPPTRACVIAVQNHLAVSHQGDLRLQHPYSSKIMGVIL
ncbi:hypothetical protein L1887_06439 [Cichorium endivia]|nr:hypothetical protein L1887_06439 [Cichorium endivia]